MTSLRVSRAHFPVTALGPGRRLAVWVQGCDLACPGCMSRDTWPADGGQEVPVAQVVQLWQQVGAEGLTISGGEPGQQAAAVRELIEGVRAVPFGGAEPDVLLYTGYTEPELAELAPGLAEAADAVVFGRFEIARPTDLLWRGSAGQVLKPMTALGNQRYGRFVEARTAEPPVQFAVEDDRIWTIGVPRAGQLTAVEKQLRQRGIEVAGVSWRP
ncbi:radical SAM protein [Kineosporia rhizophila]|uniref:4Fe-4S single cluster domain-containing protein n=1 Tax=Kineosporia TaxID=49184 RepID=UPI001E4BE217|nr:MULTISPECIES: 4Fe-4S single cluster domain-containing protein [Kineosporia]MCE0537672.1 radical SAM protein [Kineosporia rhizophila]GLY18813.1 radical activating enzyme [Kineosporia sp. NBRC 101677]